MRIKKWLATMLAAAFVAPCAVRADEPIVIQWQTANLVENQFAPIWKPMVAAFEAANPGVKIEPILVARKDHWTRFVTAAQARRAPCVVEADILPAAYNGYLLPLDKYWSAEPAAFRNAWTKDVLDGARYEGKLYGVPIWAASTAKSTTSRW